MCSNKGDKGRRVLPQRSVISLLNSLLRISTIVAQYYCIYFWKMYNLDDFKIFYMGSSLILIWEIMFGGACFEPCFFPPSPADSTFDSGQGSTVYSDSQSSQQSVVLGSLADGAPPPSQCVCSPPVSVRAKAAGEQDEFIAPVPPGAVPYQSMWFHIKKTWPWRNT